MPLTIGWLTLSFFGAPEDKQKLIKFIEANKALNWNEAVKTNEAL